jgi:predicted O-linked N-acetylglucosamine transferase (SPINDLY family)
VLSRFKQHKEALMCFEKALQNKPNLEFAEGNRLHEKLLLCEWSDLDADIERLLSGTRKGTPTEPFHLLSIPATPGDLLTAARRFVTDRFPISHPAQRQRSAHHDRIRIAYLSFDFRAHPVADLIAGLFEEHDKLRFEVTAISVGPDDGSEVRQRIKAACEHFIDAQRQGDEEIVGLIQQRGIDIAVDLNGFTQGTRMGALLRRPAALQVNYLGYPGTLGSSQFDYIIVDDTIVPEHECGFYTEKCVWLPHTFQVNDRRRAIAESTPSRRECGLPEAGAVFCCFNTNYKITPAVFGVWMRLLGANEGSVLWLRHANEAASANLRREAEARGISSQRLIFAPRTASAADHLARYRVADLFLDTLPYNAHATATDALWAGLPVLTCMGSTFASRVAASLLKAAGLPELITNSLQEYEAMALALASDPRRLALLKEKLAHNHSTSPLFDTASFTRHLEAAYQTMWERHQRGYPPDHIRVAQSAAAAQAA